MPSLRCSIHPNAAAVARCQRCNTRLCDECFRLLADDQPVCDRCALEITRGPPSRWPVAVAFVGATVAICTALARAQKPTATWGWWGFVIAVAVVVAIFIGRGSARPEAKARPPVRIGERDPELVMDAAHLERAPNPYRMRIARVARWIVPLSGRSTALVMGAAFIASAVALPVGLRLPHWVEFEVVLGAWWAAIFALLALLLYTGRRLAEDHHLNVRSMAHVFGSSEPARNGGRPAKSPDWIFEGCVAGGLDGLALVLILGAAMVAAWLVVELVLPVVFFAFYYFVVRALGRVTRDRHGCRGRLGASLGRGAVWATLCVAPVALVTWSAHAILRHHHRVELRAEAAGSR